MNVSCVVVGWWLLVAVVVEEEEGWRKRARDAQGKVLQAKFAWAGSIVKGLAPNAVGAENRTAAASSHDGMAETSSCSLEAAMLEVTICFLCFG